MSDHKKAGEFCWSELLTNDPKTAAKFYTELFGWTAHDMDMGGQTYTVFSQQETEIAGMMKIPSGHEQDIPPHWFSYVKVDRLEDSIAKVEQLGGRVECPITPTGEFGRFCIVQDPTGANIALWEATD